MQASPGPPRFADRVHAHLSTSRRVSSRYTARNGNFVLVVLASPFDSIAHRAFCLLAPDSSLPSISRRDIKGEALRQFVAQTLSRRVRTPADTSCRSSSKRRDESGTLADTRCPGTLSRRRSERHTGHRIASACQPRRNRYTSPSFPGLTLWLPLPRSFRLPDGRRFAGPSFAIAGSPRLSATSEAGCRIRRARG